MVRKEGWVWMLLVFECQVKKFGLKNVYVVDWQVIFEKLKEIIIGGNKNR